jgi:hypothetical protein
MLYESQKELAWCERDGRTVLGSKRDGMFGSVNDPAVGDADPM